MDSLKLTGDNSWQVYIIVGIIHQGISLVNPT